MTHVPPCLFGMMIAVVVGSFVLTTTFTFDSGSRQCAGRS